MNCSVLNRWSDHCISEMAIVLEEPRQMNMTRSLLARTAAMIVVGALILIGAGCHHKPGDAQVEFMKVLEIDPKNAATHVALGNLYSDQNQRGLAENQYRAAVALEPDRYNYHLDLG